ncbi:MAG: hypothetical protein AAFU41_08310 [Pseudomonadota bacterium]
MSDTKATPQLKLVASQPKVLFYRYRSTGPSLTVVSDKPAPTNKSEES